MKDGKFKISITLGSFVTAAIVVIAVYAAYLLRDILLAMITAIVVSSAINPGVKFFEKRKVPRVLGVLIIYLVAGSFIGSILFLVVPTFLTEASGLLTNIPSYIEQINAAVPLLDNSFFEGYAPLLKDLAERISNAGFVDSLSGDGAAIVDASLVGNATLTFLLVLVLSFYFSVTKDGVGDFLRIVTPEKYETYVIGLWGRTREKIGAWMQGQLLLGALVGSIVYMILAILNVKHALLLGFLAGAFELIPVFGPTLAAIPAVSLALLDGGIGFAIIVLMVYVIVQQFENNLFYPLVVQKMVGIPPVLVIVSLVVGAKLAGFLGVLLSVPASVLLVEFLDDLDKWKLRHKGEE